MGGALLSPDGRRRIIGSFSHGSMANALPQAIGAQFTDRGRQVVSMSGDGGFSMLMGDFLTLVQYDLPVKVVLFNNSSLGMVELEMLVAGLPALRDDQQEPRLRGHRPRRGRVRRPRWRSPSEPRRAAEGRWQPRGPRSWTCAPTPTRCRSRRRSAPKQVKGFALAMSRLVLSGDADEVVNMARSNLRNLQRP